MSQAQQNINLHIYDTDINVKVPANEEEQWRKAAQLINERLNAYYGAYKGKIGDKEIIYYAMIDIALNFVKEEQRKDVSKITDILSHLSSEIDEAIKQ